MKTIPLTQGKFAIVDDADYELVSAFKWQAGKQPVKSGVRWVARRSTVGPNGTHVTPYMHRLILSETIKGDIDHRNGNTLDNRRENLRPCTHRQNCQNQQKAPGKSSRFKGVSWYPIRRKWRVRINVNGIMKLLGFFADEQAAADAYDEAALRYFGEFALTNKQLNRA